MNEIENALNKLEEKIEEIRRLPSHRCEIEVLQGYTDTAHGIIVSAFHGNENSRFHKIFDIATEDLLRGDLKLEHNPKSYRLLLLSILNDYAIEMRSELKK